MFHPTRDGCRGGRDQFSWDTVDKKHCKNYLGNSVKVPHIKNKDLFWYAKTDKKEGGEGENDLERERRVAKEREEQLMGFYLKKGLGAELTPEQMAALRQDSKKRDDEPKEDKKKSGKERVERKTVREERRKAKEAKRKERKEKGERRTESKEKKKSPKGDRFVT